MKRYLIILTATILTVACGKIGTSSDEGSRAIHFSVTGQEEFIETRSEGVQYALLPSDDDPGSEPLILVMTEEDGIHLYDVETRGSLSGSSSASSLSFGVSGFQSNGTTPLAPLQDFQPVYSSSTAAYETGLDWPDAAFDVPAPTYKFYAYSPFINASAVGVKQSNGLTLQSGYKKLKYDAVGIAVSAQPDLMTSYAESAYNGKGVPLTFTHRLCAVQFKLSAGWVTGCKITGISFSNIVSNGTLTIGGSWSLGSAGSYTVSGLNDVSTEGAVVAGAPSTYLMMIPQTVTSNTLTVTVKDNNNTSHTYTASLNGTWTAGKTVTYSIAAMGIKEMTVSYPYWTNASNGNNASGPVTSYTTSDKFGLYVLDENNNVLYSNLQVGVSSVSSRVATLNLSSHTDKFFSPRYHYFLYYPYQSTAPSVTASATTPEAFFANTISSWTPAATQNTLDTFKAQDLQVGSLSGTAFTMSHRMGLYRPNPTTKEVPEKATFTNGGTTPTYSTTNVTVMASTSFNTATSNRLLYTTSNGYWWTIVKANSETTNETVTLKATGRDSWSKNVSNVGYGQYRGANITSSRTYKIYEHVFTYTGSVKSFTVPWDGNYTLEVWGAQGCSYSGDGLNITGGKGGYSKGTKNISTGTTLYVMVGQQGQFQNSSNNYTASAWPNGGPAYGNSDARVGSGGGSTHIANSNTMPQSFGSVSDFTSHVLIMAGGGGGVGGTRWGSSAWNGHGGSGGGTQGNAGTQNNSSHSYQPGGGGTQTAPGAGHAPSGESGVNYLNGKLGMGGGGSASGGRNGCGGGGGFYGGGGSWGAGGGGGSGYIGGVTGGTTTAGQRTGDGYARVTSQE